jgi:tetratricopeptide (TPR) repeat protein
MQMLYHNQYNALASLGQYTAAIACYAKAIQLKKNLVDAYNNQDLTLYALGQVEEALACFDKALGSASK